MNPVSSTVAISPRMVSLDALRGFDMFCLLIADGIIRALAVAQPDHSILQFLKQQFTHPDWEGFTFYDLIFPLFEFLIGVSVFLSIRKQLNRGNSRQQILQHALIRVLIMVFLGMWVNGNLLMYDPKQFRLTYSVLQMLAVAYLIATLFVLFTGSWGQCLGFLGLLIGYWALQTYVPLPDQARSYVDWTGTWIEAPAHQTGVYVPGGVFSFWLDEQIFGSMDKWKVGWILESMTHGCSALLGVFAARILGMNFSAFRKTILLLLMGLVCLALAWIWWDTFPVIKNLWTSSFVLFAGGWSFCLLALFFGIIDGVGWQRWAFPFVVIGSNSLLAYMMATIFQPVPAQMSFILFGGLQPYTEEWFPVILSAGTGLFAWLFLLLRYRTRTFVRI